MTIEGHTDIAFSEDVAARFLAYGWNVTTVADPNDLTLLDRAYQTFLKTNDRPTLILVHSHIGYGAPHLQDSPKAHGEPLGDDELKLTKKFFGFDARQELRRARRGAASISPPAWAHAAPTAHAAWDKLLAGYRARLSGPGRSRSTRSRPARCPRAGMPTLPTFPADPKGVATRDASGKVLNALAQRVPWLLGGAADLAPSTKTNLTFEGAGSFEAPGHGIGNYRRPQLPFRHPRARDGARPSTA